MLDQALHAAEARCIHEEFHAGSHTKRFFASAANQERKHGPKALHLATSDVVSGMRWEARVVDGLDGWTCSERGGDRVSVG